MATDYPEARALALAAILPPATDVYIALWLGDPINGGVEITLAGYARVAFQSWATSVPSPGESMRDNTVAITFPAVTAAGTADYWAIFDLAVAGVLLRSGLVLNIVGAPTPIVFPGGPGDNAEFPIGQLRIKAVEA